MSITVNDVEHVASLARLRLTEEEKQLYTEQLNTIINYANKLSSLDTEDVVPTSHILPLVNVMREDERKPSLPIEKVLANAPDDEDGQFRVPAVLE
ncbi:Asp-tRNA(Asn)/Glu-tRNA(Gln) amidotransferase subunit GatC [Paenibacillus yanchengensis]|uniref:Aspartyl/glutamyl-tRNA(Asn/Gln) amidotransferase subunit C n=1 Tax=Paenibacillus yanchengensis TaxID=2035833 RepID=A0ABW4YJJ9_9BACL